MTREEANRTLSLHLMQCGAMMPIEWVRQNGEGSELMEAFRMALDALHEQEERSKGCEYCDGKQKLLPCIDGYSSFNVIEYNAEGKPVLNDSDGCDIWIKFCPMCGRKLEVDA